MTGRIVKALSGFYYIQNGGELAECTARGLFRLRGITPLVGDNVVFELTEENKGRVTEILPRKISVLILFA